MIDAAPSLPSHSPRYQLRKPMTVAQARVTDAVARGLTPAQIATTLGISRKTVYVHISQIADCCLPSEFYCDQRPYVRLLRWCHMLATVGLPSSA